MNSVHEEWRDVEAVKFFVHVAKSNCTEGGGEVEGNCSKVTPHYLQ